MLVPSDAANIVPGVGLMAKVALLHARMFLPCHHHRNHVEVMHVMAWRSLMALRAFGRTCRRMQEPGNLPRLGAMAVRTFPSEQVTMRASVAVATEAIERSGAG